MVRWFSLCLTSTQVALGAPHSDDVFYEQTRTTAWPLLGWEWYTTYWGRDLARSCVIISEHFSKTQKYNNLCRNNSKWMSLSDCPWPSDVLLHNNRLLHILRSNLLITLSGVSWRRPETKYVEISQGLSNSWCEACLGRTRRYRWFSRPSRPRYGNSSVWWNMAQLPLSRMHILIPSLASPPPWLSRTHGQHATPHAGDNWNGWVTYTSRHGVCVCKCWSPILGTLCVCVVKGWSPILGTLCV